MECITNPQLKELDREVTEFYKLNERYCNSLENVYGKEVYKSKLKELLTKCDSINGDSEFDRLLLKNIHSNLSLNNLVIDYVTDYGFSLTSEKFIDAFAGAGVWNYLEENFKNAPWEQRWLIGERRQKLNQFRVNPSVDEAKDATKKWLPIIKNDVLNYGKSKSILPRDFDINLFLLFDEDNSYWDSETNAVYLNYGSFEHFLDKGKVIVNPIWAYKTAFHEILGHAAHQINSRNLPSSLRFSSEIGTIIPTKSVTEGVAKNKDKECFAYIRKNLDNLGINEEAIQIVEVQNDLGNKAELESLYASLIKDKELREKGFDSYEYILDLTKNKIIADIIKNKFNHNFINKIVSIGHALGALHYNKMQEKITQEFGEKFLMENQKRIGSATLKGVWSWEVYPDAVSYFLRKD